MVGKLHHLGAIENAEMKRHLGVCTGVERLSGISLRAFPTRGQTKELVFSCAD